MFVGFWGGCRHFVSSLIFEFVEDSSGSLFWGSFSSHYSPVSESVSRCMSDLIWRIQQSVPTWRAFVALSSGIVFSRTRFNYTRRVCVPYRFHSFQKLVDP